MTAGYPSDDPTVRGYAVDAVCRVRDYDPSDTIEWLTKLPAEHLARITHALAEMVPIDGHIAQLLAWHETQLVDHRTEPRTHCQKGHLLTTGNRLRNGYTPEGRQRWRCKRCLDSKRKEVAV